MRGVPRRLPTANDQDRALRPVRKSLGDASERANAMEAPAADDDQVSRPARVDQGLDWRACVQVSDQGLLSGVVGVKPV